MAKCTFLTHHAFVLIHIARHPRATLREIALKTEKANDLRAALDRPGGNDLLLDLEVQGS